MRERELKKEWIEVSQVTDSTLAECLTASRDRGRKHRESERRVSDGESERQRAEFGVFVWSELKEGLMFSSNGAFCSFFFFSWISAWIGRFGSFGRYGPSQSRVGASRLKKNKCHVAWCSGMRRDTWAEASLARRRVGRGYGTSSAASVLHSCSSSLWKLSLWIASSQWWIANSNILQHASMADTYLQFKYVLTSLVSVICCTPVE